MFAKPAAPLLNDAHPLAEGLIGAWLFTEGNGARATDQGRAPTHGALVAAPAWTPGNFGPALVFNGTTQFVSLLTNVVPAPSPLATLAAASSGYAFSAWIRTTGVVVAGGALGWACGNTIIEGRNTGAAGTARAWSFGLEGGKLATARSNGIFGGTTNRFVSIASVNDNLWHHVVASVDVNAVSLYIDGRLDTTAIFTATGDCSLATAPANMYVQIAARSTNVGATANWWQGGLDDLLIFNRALTYQDVRALHADSFAMFRRPSAARRLFVPSGPPPPIAVAVAETITLADATNAGVVTAGAVAETAALADALSCARITVGQVAEVVALADAPGAVALRAASLAEAAALTDALNAVATVPGVAGIGEALALADAPDAVRTTAATLAEAAALADAVAGSKLYAVSVAEALAAGDAAGAIVAQGAVVAETLSTADAPDAGAVWRPAVAEALALADRPLTGSIFDNIVGEALALADVPELLFAPAGYRKLAGPARVHVLTGPPRERVRVGERRQEVI